MKQTKLPKGKKKNCVIYTNLKQNKRVCTSYVCDECGVALCIGQCWEKYHTKKALQLNEHFLHIFSHDQCVCVCIYIYIFCQQEKINVLLNFYVIFSIPLFSTRPRSLDKILKLQFRSRILSSFRIYIYIYFYRAITSFYNSKKCFKKAHKKKKNLGFFLAVFKYSKNCSSKPV